MKHQKIVQVLDRIPYLIGKQGISYQRTQKMSPTNQNELIGKLNHSNDLKKVERRSISVDKVTYVYVYIYV